MGRNPGGRMKTARLLVLVGTLTLAYGIFGILSNAAFTTPLATAFNFAITIMINDLLLIPFVILVCGLTGFLPSHWQPPFRTALMISGILILIALWGIEGQIRAVQPGNSSILPNQYAKSLAILLIPVWVLSMGIAFFTKKRTIRRSAGAVDTAG